MRFGSLTSEYVAESPLRRHLSGCKNESELEEIDHYRCNASVMVIPIESQMNYVMIVQDRQDQIISSSKSAPI